MTGWTGPSATWAPSYPVAQRVSTSRKEIGHLLLAASVLTFDFAVLVGGLRTGIAGPNAFLQVFGPALLFGAIAALSGFIAHEMAHKVVAQRRGYWAEFRMSPMGLLLSLVTAFLGFLFAAPGATVVSGMSDRRGWGLTSLAGPVVNLVEGGALLGVVYLLAGALAPWDSLLLSLAFFNGWFATFNLLPIGPLDGNKVRVWSLPVWVGTFALSAAFTVFTFFLPTLPFAP